MSSQDVETRRAAAEREVRRGNFRTALDTYRELVAAHPGDPELASRLSSLEELLQPMELAHPKAGSGVREATTDLELGEARANAGDLPAAIAAYERAVAADPHNELVRERLAELRTAAGPAEDAVAVLEGLLERIAARRRNP